MPLLNSIFGGCSSNDVATNRDEDVERRLNVLELKYEIIITTHIKRLEDKIDMKFNILSSKLDNILMIMNANFSKK